MSLKTLPKSLIAAAAEVFDQDAQRADNLTRTLAKESLSFFNVSDVSTLTESDIKAMHSWATKEFERRMALTEAECTCGATMAEDDKADADHDGDGEIESGSAEYLGAKDKAIKAAMKNEDDSEEVSENDEVDLDEEDDVDLSEGVTYQVFVDNKLESSHSSQSDAKQRVDQISWSYKNRTKEPFMRDNKSAKPKIEIKVKNDVKESVALSADDIATNGAVGEAASMTDKQKFSALRNINHVEVRRGSAGKNRMDTSLHYMGKKLASMDSPINSSSRRPEHIWITPEGDDLLKKQGILKENVALSADDIATNGAVGVGDASLATPKHADVIKDSSPLDGTSQYRMLVQFATNTGTQIVPSASLPGAPTVEALREIVEGLPYFNDVMDAALTNAA